MWEIEKTPNELTVREHDARETNMVIFSGISAFLVITYTLYDFAELKYLEILFALGLSVLVLWLLFDKINFPTFSIRVNKTDKTFTLIRRNLFNSDLKVYFFDDLVEIFIDVPEDNKHSLQMELKDGSIITISNLISANSSEAIKTAEAISSFIFESPLPIALKRNGIYLE